TPARGGAERNRSRLGRRAHRCPARGAQSEGFRARGRDPRGGHRPRRRAPRWAGWHRLAGASLNRLQTERLDLVQLDHACIQAWIARDATKLEELTGARFPEPVDAPPLFAADLPRILDTLVDGR